MLLMQYFNKNNNIKRNFMHIFFGFKEFKVCKENFQGGVLTYSGLSKRYLEFIFLQYDTGKNN